MTRNIGYDKHYLKIVSQNAPDCISAHIHFKTFPGGMPCNTTKTSVALPIRANIFTGVQRRPRSNGTIGILTDPWRPILRCYYDFVQWIILLGHEVCAIGFEKITCMSSFCQVASQNGSLNYICG